jgi:hypothetical protein
MLRGGSSAFNGYVSLGHKKLKEKKALDYYRMVSITAVKSFGVKASRE